MTLIQRTIISCWTDAIGFGSIVCCTKSKINDEDGDQFVEDKSLINERMPSSTTVAKGVLNNGEHTLIPVTAKMIHSAVCDSERFVLKDGQPLQMVKLVGAVRNFRVNIKHVQIIVEDGTGLVRVIYWRKEKKIQSKRVLGVMKYTHRLLDHNKVTQ